MVKIANKCVYVPRGGEKARKKSIRVANTMAAELMNYGIVPDAEILERISTHKKADAKKLADGILKGYTIGDVNPPLFRNWEERDRFTIGERLLQIYAGYMLKVDGNDLDDPQWTARLKASIDYRKVKRLRLSSEDDVAEKFNKLVNSKVALDKESVNTLFELAKEHADSAPQNIRSDEARVAVLRGMVAGGSSLYSSLRHLNCKPADCLRYTAAAVNLEYVKLPSDVRYANVTNVERKAMFDFLTMQNFGDLCEAMGNNRTAWARFLKHFHILNYEGHRSSFKNRYAQLIACSHASLGSRLDSIPERVRIFLGKYKGMYEITDGGNIAYRTFASRVQSAIDAKDLDAFKAEVQNKPGYVFRNLSTVSNVCTKKNQSEFVEFIRGMIDKCSASIMFSIVQIGTGSEYRIIDSKGNTTVTEADYNPVITEIQGLCKRELYRRYGYPGQVKVSKSLKDKIVPFLSTNAELDRGTRVKFEDTQYLYFLMHWVQARGRTTDLDHSYMAFDAEWNAKTVYFGNQANQYMKHGGDIISAPAPNGATEYGRINLQNLPNNIKYIVPIINVYSGDDFAKLPTAYAGWMFSDEAKFSIKRDHVRYDLTQPALSNIPFVVDIKNKEIVVVDFNNRMKISQTARGYASEIKKIISALKTKNFMSIQKLADILSGDDNEVSLEIKKTARTENQISPEDLFSLFD